MIVVWSIDFFIHDRVRIHTAAHTDMFRLCLGPLSRAGVGVGGRKIAPLGVGALQFNTYGIGETGNCVVFFVYAFIRGFGTRCYRKWVGLRGIGG